MVENVNRMLGISPQLPKFRDGPSCSIEKVHYFIKRWNG